MDRTQCSFGPDFSQGRSQIGRGVFVAKGFLASLSQASRIAIREAERQARAQVHTAREAERAFRLQQRAQVAEIKEQKRLYVESRVEDVDTQVKDLEQAVAALSGLLVSSLTQNPCLSFSSLLVKPSLQKLDFGRYANPEPVPTIAEFMPAKPHWAFGWLPPIRKAFEIRVAKANQAFSSALSEHTSLEMQRQQIVERMRKEHEEKILALQAEVNRQSKEIEAFKAAFESAESEAVATYCKMVLGNSPYPEGFSREAHIIYVAESKQLVVDYDLPSMEVVPAVKIYKYVKTNDTVTEVPRPEVQRRALYTSIVAQTVLRTLRELFDADYPRNVESVVLNGYVNAIDRGTGQSMRPCLVTVRTSKDTFAALDLRHVEAAACLRTLNASLSKSPAELAPVRPILELNMVDPRFIKESDVLSTLDQRLNLMELSPSEFESLITNLFEKMGLETRQTQASRDGGVDCVAFDPRPIFGGKVVIQAKRYKNTVGVSAVRDLYGTMQNEGASKGILVTTSGYGKASFEFANGKPMELLGGSNLLFLLKEHADLEAKIVVPEYWQDPHPDH